MPFFAYLSSLAMCLFSFTEKYFRTLIIDATELSLCLDLLCTFLMLNIMSSKALGYETIARFLLSGKKMEFTPSHFRIGHRYSNCQKAMQGNTECYDRVHSLKCHLDGEPKTISMKTMLVF